MSIGQRATVCGALGAMALALSVPAAAAAPTQDAEGESTTVEADEALGSGQVVIDDGHIDVGPRFIDETWTLLVRDDTVDPSLWRELSDVVVHVVDGAVLEVPDDPTFGFLGDPGDPVWLLPQVQQLGIAWPGWNTQDPDVAVRVDREVTWQLRGVEGPGAFVLFVNGNFGQPATLFDSREPYPQETGIDTHTHAHGNWVFTEPGLYRLDIVMSATVDGDEHADEGTLLVAVGDDTDPTVAFDLPVVEEASGIDGETETETDDEPGTEGTDGAADGDDGASDSGGSSWPVVLAVVAGAVVICGAGVLLYLRRRAGNEDQP